MWSVQLWRPWMSLAPETNRLPTGAARRVTLGARGLFILFVSLGLAAAGLAPGCSKRPCARPVEPPVSPLLTAATRGDSAAAESLVLAPSPAAPGTTTTGQPMGAGVESEGEELSGAASEARGDSAMVPRPATVTERVRVSQGFRRRQGLRDSLEARPRVPPAHLVIQRLRSNPHCRGTSGGRC